MPLAFAPYDWPLISVFSLLLFLFVLAQDVRQHTMLKGYLFGLGYFGHGVYWVYFSIYHFGNAPLWLAILIMLGMVAILASYIALLAYMLNRFFKQQPALRYLLAFPTLWVGVEWLRSVLFTGFPWLTIGYSQIDTWLSGWGPIFGVLGMSWLLVLTAGSIFYFFSVSSAGQRLMAIMLILMSWMGGFFLDDIKWVKPSGEPLKVALLQGNIPQEIKWLPSFRQRSIGLYQEMTDQQSQAKVVIWPETAIPAFYHQVKNGLLPALREQASKNKMDVVVGLPVMADGGSKYYNALYSVQNKNAYYFKRHLVPLGEYMPLKPLSTFILDFLNIPLSDFSAGASQQKLLQAGGYPFASSICYEDVFQQSSLDGLPQAAYLVNISNDTWFGDTIAPYQHMQIARMRALESGRYLLRSTSTGITAIVNEKGSVTAQAPMFTRYALTGEMLPMSGSTPFVKAGWWLIILCLVIGSIVCVLKRDR